MVGGVPAVKVAPPCNGPKVLVLRPLFLGEGAPLERFARHVHRSRVVPDVHLKRGVGPRDVVSPDGDRHLPGGGPGEGRVDDPPRRQRVRLRGVGVNPPGLGVPDVHVDGDRREGLRPEADTVAQRLRLRAQLLHGQDQVVERGEEVRRGGIHGRVGVGKDHTDHVVVLDENAAIRVHLQARVPPVVVGLPHHVKDVVAALPRVAEV
mmetsp:Transcript_67310/g.152301  ORF Transcript_67310/g.152301 Transcript_67310/m.152301 type:complete len:207 (+) Transcript_67310:5436-6056(+)